MPLIYDPQTGDITETLPERPTRASSSSKPKAKPKRVQEVLPPGGKQEFGVSRFPTIEESVTEEQTKRLKTRRQAGKKFRRPRLEDRDPSIRGIRASTEAERQLDTRYEVNRDFGLEGVANIVDTTAQSLGEFAVGLPENVAALGLAVSDKMRKMRGLEPQTEEYAEALEAIAQPTRAAKDTVRSYFPTDLEMDKSWAYGKIPRAAASSLPYIGLGALGGGPAAVAMLGAVENAGQTYEEAVAKGASHEDALKAALPGGVIGTLEGALGVGRVGFLRRMSQRGVVGGAAHGAIEEGLVQEAITQLANNVNAKLVSGYDPKRAFTDGLAESILTGGAVGLLFGGWAGAAARLSSVPRRETSLPQMDLEISPIADDRAQGYYSALTKNIQEKFPAKIKLDDVRKRLTSESSGVKKEEYEFSSLDELLAVKRAEGSDTITKHELLDYLAENHIQVHERTLGGPGIEALKERQVKLYEERNALSSELVEVERGLIKPYADWLMEQTDDTVLAAPQTNYIRQRNAIFDSSPEHNLILERKREIDDEIAVLQQALNLQGPIGAESEVIKGGQPGTMREIVLSVQGTDGPAYTGGHFGHIPNTVAYVRFNEGVDSEGRKILIGQNFQSDVHQAGRGKESVDDSDEDLVDGEFVERLEARQAAKDRAANLPFKTTWPDLLVKRLVKYAADNGFDRIVWTTGQQQIDYWSGSVGEGEGHRIIYDEKLPKAAKALAKKFGSKYGTADPITGPPEVKENTGENAKSHPWRVADREFVSKANAELYASSLDKSVQKIHYLDITPAMREQAQGEGFALFDRASKKGRMPQTDEEDTIRRWGVPRWDPNVNREPASQMVQFARFEFRPHGNRGRIYTNNIGTVILKAVDHMVQQGKAVTNPSDELTQEWFSHGRAIPIWVAEEHIKWLNANAHQSPVLESLRDEMVRAAAAAVRRGQEAIPVISLDRTDVDSIRQTIRHEDIHRWQWGHESMYGYVVDPLWAKLQPWYKSAVAALRGRGYNFPVKFDGTYTVELLAHLGAGQHERLGFTAEQGAQVVASIMKHIASTRGMSALKNLALDAKVKERINDLARISERSGPRATAVVPVTEYFIRPSGGIRERLSKWFGPRGGSETAVPEHSPVADDFENVDTNVDPPGRWERLKTALRGHGLPFEFTWLDKLKRLGIDEAHPILKAWHFIQTGQEAPSKNAEYLLRLWLGSNGKVDRVFSEGMINGQNQIVTPGGLDWLLDPWQGAPKSQMMDEMEAAIHMMVAERTLELATKKWGQPNSGLSITAPISGVADTVTLQQQAGDQFMADIQASIRKLNQLQQRDPQALARIQDAADRYRKWARALLDYQLEKGRLKQETYDQLVANGDYYVDMHRLFDDDPDSMLDSTPGKYGKVKKLMRKFKGSREEISNPYVNLMIATQQTIKESDRNYAMNAFVEPLRQQQPDPQMQALYHMIGHRTPQATKDSVRVYNQGAEEHWEFHPEIEAALKGYGDIPGNVITDVLSLPFKILRTAITHTPGFLFRNFVRDAQQRTLLSRGNTSIRQILNPLEGSKPWDALTQIIRPLSKADRDSFWLTGASQAGYYANSRIDWQARLRDAVNDVRGDRSVLLAFPEQLWQFIAKDLPAGVENINRFAEFKEQRKQALAQGMSQYDADIKAAFEARDLMDFAVSGTAVKQLNKFVMFLNPALQGIKRTAKGAREAPLPFLFRWSLYALMPALGELWWNFGQGDDTLEEWRNMPAWRKDLFYNLKVGDDKWLAIPKPFELGVAASLTNRLIDYSVLDNKQAFDDAGKSIWKSLIPIDDWSKLVGPFLSVAEVGSNWSYFYDEHIIPPGDEGRDPELARKRGSFVGQQIAKIIDKDPRLIDYFLRANLSDWATIANYTGELFNAELNPKERSEIYKKLVTLSTGNVVRPTKPDQAVDVKRVMNAATRTYGDRADWYTPLTDYINAYRDTPEASEREKVVRDALAYASRVRQFLPQLDKDLKESIQKLEKLEATNPSYKSLDKKARGVVDSRLRSDLRSFDHEIMTARVRGDKIAKAQAIVNKRSYNLSLALAQEILQYREQTQEKALERRVTPPMPRR